ncbi:MAG: hypothetical protein AB7O73_15200, partial [Bacteroidia bacterium]
MKKAISILLAFVFLISSSGFSINRHYCGNKLKSTNIGFIDNEKSCCGAKKMPEGCCKNETQVIKIKENFTPTQTVTLPSTDFITVFVLAFVEIFNFSLTENNTIGQYADSHAPPSRPVSRIIL